MKRSNYWIVVLLTAFLFTNCQRRMSNLSASAPADSMAFDWQGHRGARGILPENTIPAFLHALEYSAITTLELDLAVAKDGALIVSHEPWLAATISTHASGVAVTEAEEHDLRIYGMTQAEVQAFDVGQRGNSRFPEQLPLPTFKPTLAQVVVMADTYARTLGRPLPYYNIEIKSLPEWDNTFTPIPEDFAGLVIAELNRLSIAKRTTVQSFDIRSLEAIHQQAPEQMIAYLIANEQSLTENLALLSFTPQIYSPYYELCTPELVTDLHKRNIRLIPWTVNKVSDMQRLRTMGVDGIITDYPNRIE